MGNKTASSVLKIRDVNNSKHGNELLEKAGPKTWAPRRFTERQVREIRADRRPVKVIAAQYGVTHHAIRQIQDGRNYAWVI
jgi:hypothetical protein